MRERRPQTEGERLFVGERRGERERRSGRCKYTRMGFLILGNNEYATDPLWDANVASVS